MRFDSSAELQKVDKINLKLLKILSEDCRRPVKQMGKAVRLSPEGVTYRIKRMEEFGILKAFSPRFTPKGWNRYHVFLMIDELFDHTKLVETFKNNHQARSIIQYSDKWDYEIVMYAESAKEFDKEFMSCIQSFHKHVIRKTIVEELGDSYEISIPTESAPPKNEIILEQKDQELIKHMAKDARASSYTIGAKIKTSPDTASRRIKDLAKKGVRWTTTLNLSTLGHSVNTFVIKTRVFNKKLSAKLSSFAESEPAIIFATRTLGEWDVLFRISSKDNKTYHEVVKRIKKEFADIILDYDAYIIEKEHHYNSVPDVLFH